MLKGFISFLEMDPFYMEIITVKNDNEFLKIYLHNYKYVLKYIKVNNY